MIMKYCPDCGAEVQDNMVFCSSCGQKLEYTSSEAVEMEEAKREKKWTKEEMNKAKNNEIGFGITGVVLMIGGIGFITQRVVTADFFDIKIMMIDQSAIGGVVAILISIACVIGAEKYRKKYKELMDKL